MTAAPLGYVRDGKGGWRPAEVEDFNPDELAEVLKGSREAFNDNAHADRELERANNEEMK